MEGVDLQAMGTSRRGWVLALVATGVVATLLAMASAAHAGTSWSVVYSGEETYSSADKQGNETVESEYQEASVSWSTTASDSEGHETESPPTLTGKWKVHGTERFEHRPYSCSGTYGPSEIAEALILAHITESRAEWEVEVTPPGFKQIGASCVKAHAIWYSSGAGNPYEHCVTGYDCLNFPLNGSYTQEVNFDPPAETAEEGKWTRVYTLHSTVTFTSGLSSPSTPGPGSTTTPTTPSAPEKNTDPSKHDAAVDLGKAVEDAEVPCAAAGLGSLAGASKGGLLTTSLAGASASQQLGEAGDAVYNAWRERCEAAINRIKFDYKTAEDPPASDWRALAEPRKLAHTTRASSCKRRHGIALTRCKLEAAARAASADARRSAALSEAVEVTISRETAALDERSPSTASSQRAHAASLQSEFEKALATEKGEEATFSSLLRSLHVKTKLTKKAATAADKLIVDKLAHAGVTRGGVEKLAGPLPS